MDDLMRPALGVAGVMVCWWMAFCQTPDLETVDGRLQYRVALMAFYMSGLRWLFDVLGLI